MAAYAAVTSLKYILDQLQHHPFPPISLEKEQAESLTEIVTFLQEFLEGYNSPLAHSDESDPLESRVADAAYAAEDVIESKIVDQIHSRSTNLRKMISSIKLQLRGLCKCAGVEDDVHQDLQQVIEEMNLIKKEVMEIMRDKTATAVRIQAHLLRRKVSSTRAGKDSMMVGFDDELLQLLDKLTGGQINRQIIPITGMGGTGKTTLARNLFENALIKEHFDIRAWTTISQVYNTQETLGEILCQASGNSSDLSENDLGEKLYKYLMGRRYLIVMDDIWSVEAWEKMKFFFPKDSNGSRIIVTTRLSNFTSQLSESYSLGMKFLDEVSSWDLFTKTVFHEKSFPLELEKIGKKIVTNCRGLPLSIVTIGGLLAKSEPLPEYWEYIEENLNSVVNSKNDEYCLKILKMSYNHLPVYLKPCFLYMGVFEEDCEIRVSTLVKLWVSEGFLKPVGGKSLETIAEEYLNELVERNLVMIHELGFNGNVKYCKMHDLLRDLCLREAEKERFYHVVSQQGHRSTNSLRRVVIPRNASKQRVVDALESMSRARSVICDHDKKDQMSINFMLLRTLKAYDRNSDARHSYFLEDVFQLVNLRYLAVGALDTSEFPRMSEFPSSINLLWNLQTLVIFHYQRVTAPIEIWSLPQLRHAKIDFGVRLPDPPTGSADGVVVMENLQTLTTVENFKLNKDVVKRIPNIKKLAISYEEIESNGDCYCLENLECLQKLESFQCISPGQTEPQDYLKKLTFPQSLKKLVLVFIIKFSWEDMLEKIGSLPLLQKLEMIGGSFETREWETTEGQFPNLKFLLLRGCGGLERWTTESSHFPRLESLCLDDLEELKEIPSEIGEIPTLRSILLQCCSESAMMSAKDIVDEQEELQGEQLPFHVRVSPRMRRERLDCWVRVACSESTGECVNEEQPHFHYHPEEVLDEEEDALQQLAGPNFTVI